jgi:hypothetical protein
MLMALVLMPMGMASAPAAAHVSITGPSGHCGDQQKPEDVPTAPKAHCAACAALPAPEALAHLAELRPAMLLQVEADQWVTEPGPETATPPPKIA